MEGENLVYIKPEERIYDIAVNKDMIDWKSFLYELIYKEGFDPWDIDLTLLTKKYIESLKELKKIDFDISGKFLTIAVYLLKKKTEVLLERDIRGMDLKIASLEMSEDSVENFDSIEDLDSALDELGKQKSKKYSLKYRNPIARKRKVTIFDLIKTLEKTIEQSNKRRANFFQRHGNSKYDGPMYRRKTKDLKELIEEMYSFIVKELSGGKGSLCFSKLVEGIEDKMGVLEKFVPLLHLHNQSRVQVFQDEHFGDIKIKHIDEVIDV